MALSGPISEFFHMSECWSVLPYNNRKSFRPFLAKSDDSNWIRSPKSMFWVIIGVCGDPSDTFWPLEQEPAFTQSCGLRRMTEDHKIFYFIVIPAKSYDSIFRKIPITSFWARFGPFWPKKGQRDFFLKNLIRPLFTPYIPLTSCKKNQKKNSLERMADLG